MSIEDRALSLANDPFEFFGGSVNRMGNIDRDEMLSLQRTALKVRFDDLRNKIPMLKKLAEEQGVDEIRDFNDVVPLLFEHTMYKSYPPSLLQKGRFTLLNKWLNKLTAHDIGGVDVSECQSLDAWLGIMESTPLRITHTSGTSGSMSFLPHSADEWDMLGRSMKMTILQRYGHKQHSSEPVHVVFPHFRSGFNGMLRGNDLYAKHIAGGEENFHAAYPGHMSSDVLYLAARIRAAQSRGTLDRLEISEEMLARKEEFEQLETDMPTHLMRFFRDTFARLQGKRIWASGTWNLMHDMAKSGLAQGQENLFSPDSIILSGGGAKGMTPPENWQRDVCRFIGIERLTIAYGMSEVFAHHVMCSAGRYHVVPWVIPFVLHPETSEVLPRKGEVTGRAAFFGLIARHAWGGFITGDEVTIDWDSRCACGQTTYHLAPRIQRFSEKTGDDDKITCAATPDAHREAMTFLANLAA